MSGHTDTGQEVKFAWFPNHSPAFILCVEFRKLSHLIKIFYAETEWSHN